ncbi:MAG: heparinase II/III family protein [Verrucomicrobia bacterium]|nr:heparinase II/III family protein [Verrucomicrobiota bacterium]
MSRPLPVFFAAAFALACSATAAEPLHDWSEWEKYRATVQHPSGATKPADVVRARANLARYPWAKSYATSVERAAQRALPRITPEFLATMVPDTTPGDPKFTPCPACRDQGKPVHPHGLWTWRETAPDQLVCDQCQTVFPNARYPESIELHATWRHPQTFTFYGGEPFVIFGYRTGRPSFTANIRARKVSHVASLASTFAEAHLLTGNADFARATRDILQRLAAAYPGWLVHVGYGEYADLDPRVAALAINKLPVDELCPPPNQPDRRLHTGYWSAGRASGVGQESGFVRRVTEAYDFTCTAKNADGTPVYTDAQRRLIERDLLLESTVLLVADKQINNKSVGNRTAAALVGLAVGHPGLVRFGWDGFQETINGWFLPDGTTSESPAYAMMTLHNIWDMPQALRGYTEPAGYVGPDGQRRVATDLYHGTAYERVWENCVNGLHGDLTYPAYADSYRTTTLGAQFAELLAANYPERPQYLTLLKEICGPDLTRGQASTALYYREPGLEQRTSPPFSLSDFCPPELRIGHLRSGADGRESLLLLSASHWGGHHHNDSLNLSYWREGHEVLSDLGYLWDHPKKHQLGRTVAHNTVVLDERDQRTREREGTVHFFRTSPHVKVMAASSRAYAEVSLYHRTSAVIDHGGGRTYVVDCFRVQGGRTQDFVYHASASSITLADTTAEPAAAKLYDFSNIRALTAAPVWRATWPAGPKLTAVAWNVGQPGEHAFVADGWGQRDWKNSDLGATLPYVVRRTTGESPKVFWSVFAAHAGEVPFVQRVALRPDGTLEITTALGTDLVAADPARANLAVPGATALVAPFAVASVQAGRSAWTFVAGP